MLGGIFFGILGDHFGRRFNLLAALFLHTVLGLCLHFCSFFTLFAIGYALQGALVTVSIILHKLIVYVYVRSVIFFKSTFSNLGFFFGRRNMAVL